jgi:hypothetical protein
MLKKEQHFLAEQFEMVCEQSTERVAQIAEGIRNFSSEHTRSQLHELRRAQDRVHQLLVRIEATHRTEQELERESAEWRSRSDTSGIRHVHHPEVRCEILRSELALRREAPCAETTTKIRSQPFEHERLQAIVVPQTTEIPTAFVQEDEQRFERVEFPSNQHVVQAIRMLRQEVVRYMTAPTLADEILEDLHELRALHATLKRLDREHEMCRDRQVFFL